jgi:hypothetical protein
MEPDSSLPYQIFLTLICLSMPSMKKSYRKCVQNLPHQFQDLLNLRSVFAVYVQCRLIFSPRFLFTVTTCFGLTGHHQAYRLLWWRNLLLTVIMLFCCSYVVASHSRLCGFTSCFLCVSFSNCCARVCGFVGLSSMFLFGPKFVYVSPFVEYLRVTAKSKQRTWISYFLVFHISGFQELSNLWN